MALLIAALASSALLPHDAQVLVALGAIIVLGVPHGALDGELARTVFRPRFGRAWLPLFAVPYVALVALVIVAWRIAPLPTLVGFLGLSVWHFGTEDAADGAWTDKLLRGGLPIAVPMLVHRADTTALFATIAGTPLGDVASWWWVAAVAWVAFAATYVGRALAQGSWRHLGVPGLLVAAFAVLPPLTAFALYFVCVHAPTHTAALIAGGRAERVRDARSAWVRAVPFTALTLLMGVALWPFYDGRFAPHLLALTIQLLAGLTLPHMLFGAWLDAPERSPSRTPARLALHP